MTTSSFERRGFTAQERRSIEIGRSIHEAVVDEGRREGVFAYLYHDGKGRAWFEKYDRAARKISRKFSPELAARMRQHKDDLKIYARYCEMDRFAKDDGGVQNKKTRREIAVERCRVIVEMQETAATDGRNAQPTPPPVVGSETTKKETSRHDEGLRHLLTNEK